VDLSGAGLAPLPKTLCRDVAQVYLDLQASTSKTSGPRIYICSEPVGREFYADFPR
jgi:hypothetical protein